MVANTRECNKPIMDTICQQVISDYLSQSVLDIQCLSLLLSGRKSCDRVHGRIS